MLLLLASLACSVVAPPPVAPPSPESMDAVLKRLDAASKLAATDPAGALDAWNLARWRFEQEVEPGLRATRDPLDVTAAEYSFSRIHEALAQGADASEDIATLAHRLRPSHLHEPGPAELASR